MDWYIIMAIVELLLILFGLIAVFVLAITAINKVSVYYRTQFGFSVWSGVLFLLISFLILLSVASSGSDNGNTFFAIISAALGIFTLVQDIRLSDPMYGILAFLFQIVMTLFVFVLFIILIAQALARIASRSARSISNSLSGTTQEIRYAFVLLPVFIRI